jgi:hypothetical protein
LPDPHPMADAFFLQPTFCCYTTVVKNFKHSYLNSCYCAINYIFLHQILKT